ncbi:HTTM domain-containing protein [Enhygromyxa salina]|uniref:HTTM domain-containing protein n=1 Tax=Enhygromyxa salina TaxID=215803 RepID=UPI0011BA66DC|nr:HTTM domain-containing protein [Enhygromyxa salina]
MSAKLAKLHRRAAPLGLLEFRSARVDVWGVLLALMPAGRGFSLDARWFGWGGTVPVWCRRILQLQLGIMYTVTGLAKTGDTWHVDGTAIYYTLNNPYNRHFDAGPFVAWPRRLWDRVRGRHVSAAAG